MSGPKRISVSGPCSAQMCSTTCDRVRGGAAVVGLGLDLGRGVDVHDDDGAGVLGLPGAQLVGVDRVGERAAGVGVGDQHGLVRREDRGRLGHEVDAAEDDRVGVGRGRLAREPERVAHVVGDVLDLGQLVVVGEDDGVALGGERAHLGREARDLLRRSAPGVEWVGVSAALACWPSFRRMFAGPCGSAGQPQTGRMNCGTVYSRDMPELPEVEITARRLGAALDGAEVESTLAPGMVAVKTLDPTLERARGHDGLGHAARRQDAGRRVLRRRGAGAARPPDVAPGACRSSTSAPRSRTAPRGC